ncbi:HRDC domain-containing protein [Paenibacillus sp. MWE-103]|uniref:HRDC domain-containing protein n=1 Tax=Paenibacillus artemisiicola TaxID=1172618 RepID=A0ABS3W8W6_9BACL|nr:HRDC domain-containing protein [Paenibacillus artemisiicola]MBO7744713.1 HRDC domain-containing protein [Paenibacillus artemisiicola]
MQVVFLNTFEKSGGEDGAAREAQLSICEQNGVWSVIWTDADGPLDGGQSAWYEGGSWEEMMTAFRHGVAVRMGEGFAPLIDGMLEERRSADAGAAQYAMIQCYGEMNGNAELFNALRDWRRAKAASIKKSAYLVATNRMLWMLSAYVPLQPEELMQIPGWGEAKQAAYGAEVLAVTGAFGRETSFPLDWVADRLDPKVYTKWVFKQKENKYKTQLDRQQEKRDLLRAIAEGKSIEELQAEIELPRRDLMERLEKLDLEGYDLEPLIEKELASMPASEQQLVWDALQSMGDRYLRPVLHRVYGEDAEQGKGKGLDLLYDRLRLIRLRYRRSGGNDRVS